MSMPINSRTFRSFAFLACRSFFLYGALFSALCLLPGRVAFAQEDQKAKKILEDASDATRSYGVIRADFDYVMENKEENIREENKGEVVLKGTKYRIRLPGPGVEMYCDGTAVWSYLRDANEVNITAMDDESAEMMNPTRLFTIYEHGFACRFVEETTVDGKPVYVIDLIPDDREAFEYSRIRVRIDKRQMLVCYAEMAGSEGNTYIVRVNNIKTDGVADDSIFVFDKAKYPGVEVIDLR